MPNPVDTLPDFHWPTAVRSCLICIGSIHWLWRRGRGFPSEPPGCRCAGSVTVTAGVCAFSNVPGGQGGSVPGVFPSRRPSASAAAAAQGETLRSYPGQGSGSGPAGLKGWAKAKVKEEQQVNAAFLRRPQGAPSRWE